MSAVTAVRAGFRPLTVAHVATVDVTLRFLLFSQMKAAQRAGFQVAAVSSPGPWTADLEREGIRHFPIAALGRRWDPLADLRALGELTRLFRRERFDVVHTHAPKTGVLGRIAARLASTPGIVNTVHGLYGIEPDRPVRRWFYLSLERVAASGSDFELCQSREDLELLKRLRIVRPDRFAYLGNGVDLRRFDRAAVPDEAVQALRRDLDILPGAVVVGTVGRLVLEKGYAEFLDAAERVLRARPQVRMIVVGPADERKKDALPPALIRRAEAAGVRFLGMRTDMPALYRLMDLFVLASH
ncbi:MAG: glycosyltransferase, partial [bacterium]